MNIVSVLAGFFGGVGDKANAALSVVPKTIYLIVSMIFSVVDVMQLLFRKVAGLDAIAYKIDGSFQYKAEGSDISLMLLNEPIVQEVLIAIILLSVIVLALSTIIGALRAEFFAEDFKSASKSRVLKKALSSLLGFAVVPAMCIFGLYFSNVLLKALDKATVTPQQSLSEDASQIFNSQANYVFFGLTVPTNNVPFSGMIFRAAMYNSNRIRTDNDYCDAFIQAGRNVKSITFGGAFSPNSSNESTQIDERRRAEAADRLDDVFAYGYSLKGEHKNMTIRERIENSDGGQDYLNTFSETNKIDENGLDVSLSVMNKYSVSLVWFFYDMWNFDFFLGIAGGIVLVLIMLRITMTAIQRIFDIAIMFLISPPIVALGPLTSGNDNGFLKEWRNHFLITVLRLYTPVVAMNLFFLIVPYISNISFFGTITADGIYLPSSFADAVIQVIFVLAGIFTISSLSNLVMKILTKDIFGKPGKSPDDAIKLGKGVLEETRAVTKPITQTAVGTAVTGAKVAFSPVLRGTAAGFMSSKEARSQGQGVMRSIISGAGSFIKHSVPTPKDIGKGAKDIAGSSFGSVFKHLGRTGLLDTGLAEMKQQGGKKVMAVNENLMTAVNVPRITNNHISNAVNLLKMKALEKSNPNVAAFKEEIKKLTALDRKENLTDAEKADKKVSESKVKALKKLDDQDVEQYINIGRDIRKRSEINKRMRQNLPAKK